MPDIKWEDRGLSVREVGRFIDFLKVYKNCRLISVKLVGEKYTLLYTYPYKLTENSYPYVGKVPCW